MEPPGTRWTILGVEPGKGSGRHRDQVRHAKPDPDLFIAAAARLGVDIEHSVVFGDSV